MANKEDRDRVLQVAGLFLKLGSIGFGGPAANIALMERETVTRRKWLTPEHFLNLLAVTSLLPGPVAVKMACQIGFVRAGWKGLLAGGICFILPANFLSLGLAWIYGRFGNLPQAVALLYGVNPAIIAIILVATYRLGRMILKDWKTVVLALACLVFSVLGLDEVLTIFASGLAGILLFSPPSIHRANIVFSTIFLPLLLSLPQFSGGKLSMLGLFFLKAGFLLFGGGMLLYAFIHKEIVVHYGWLTQKQFLDAIALAQLIPGPVFSSATFIGYLIGGIPGALISAIGVFLPSFVMVALVVPWVKRMSGSETIKAFLQGINAAVVALILKVAIQLFPEAVGDWWEGVILVLGVVAQLFLRLAPPWIVIMGGLLGVIRSTFATL